jgi:hydroxymethylpyrimidine kinase/phosphomethylpyrimidine kinase
MSLWIVGGLDPTGGAGALRDFVTAQQRFPMLDVEVAITAWTRQGHGRRASETAVSIAELDAQLEGFGRPQAIKIGLAPDALAKWLAERLDGIEAPIVLDPVLRASDGGALGSSVEGLRTLWNAATLVTPNRAEAAEFVGRDEDDDAALLSALGRDLGAQAVLLKSGRARREDLVVDRLWREGTIHTIERPRIEGPDPRGTGCALATAIASGLADGQDIETAVERAIAWLDEARTRSVLRNGVAYLPIA